MYFLWVSDLQITRNLVQVVTTYGRHAPTARNLSWRLFRSCDHSNGQEEFWFTLCTCWSWSQAPTQLSVDSSMYCKRWQAGREPGEWGLCFQIPRMNFAAHTRCRQHRLCPIIYNLCYILSMLCRSKEWTSSKWKRLKILMERYLLSVKFAAQWYRWPFTRRLTCAHLVCESVVGPKPYQPDRLLRPRLRSNHFYGLYGCDCNLLNVVSVYSLNLRHERSGYEASRQYARTQLARSLPVIVKAYEHHVDKELHPATYT